MDYFIHLMSGQDTTLSAESQVAQGTELKKRLRVWCDVASQEAEKNPRTPVAYDVSYDALMTLFGLGTND
jgi:hypothetical protein